MQIEIHLSHLIRLGLRHLRVKLIAFGFSEMRTAKFVVLTRGFPIAADPAHCHLSSLRFVLITEGPTGNDGCRGRRVVHLLEHIAIRRQLRIDHVPGFLRDNENADAQLRHDFHRLWRHRSRISAAFERALGLGPNVHAWLLIELALKLGMTALQTGQHQLRGFDKTLARFVHWHTKAFELHTTRAAAHAEDEPAVTHMVQHRHLLDDTQRVVPRQHTHH